MTKTIKILTVFLMISPLLFAQGKMDSSGSNDSAGGMDSGLVTFTDLEAAQMTAESGPAVLFFYADWCPVCKAELKDIKARSGELKGITVYVVDYDTTADLKRKYGVTYQHTYVQIDPRGEKLAVWNGGGLDEILNNTVMKEMN